MTSGIDRWNADFAYSAVTLVRCNKKFCLYCGYSCPVQQEVVRLLLALCYKKFWAS